MQSLLVLIKVTCKSAIRSHVFQLLLGLLIFCVLSIPYTISGDGTPEGFIKISLKYSLSFVSFILLISSIWLSCVTMGRDVESYQLHMVVAKPVSRIKIWIGKWLGVLLINAVLLLCSSLVILAIVMWNFNHQGFTDEQKEKVRNELLVGRRVFYPTSADDDLTLDQGLAAYVNELKNETGVDLSKDRSRLEKVRKQLENRKKKRLVMLKPKNSVTWTYKNLPKNLDANQKIYFRYRAFVDTRQSNKQRESLGQFTVLEPRKDESASNVGDEKKMIYTGRVLPPTTFMGAVIKEFELSPEIIRPDGTTVISFINMDDKVYPADEKPKSLVFQPTDGPKLLLATSSFYSNYFRAVLLIFLMLAGISGVACAFSSAMGIATAIFATFAYLGFGFLADVFLAKNFVNRVEGINWLMIQISKYIHMIIIPVQNFDFSEQLSTGELIEWDRVLSITLTYIVFKAVPIMIFGIWLYWRKELGLMIKK